MCDDVADQRDDPRLADTAAVLQRLPGGQALLDWFGGRPSFGDGEIVRLDLDRSAPSLTVEVMASVNGFGSGWPFKQAQITFAFKGGDMIDVSLQGFSHQNVMGDMWLRFANTSPVHSSLVGVGLGQGDIEFEIEPCFGAFGTVRATVEKITITAVEDHQEADAPASMTE
ncbi:hypothetical protein [Bosea sp. (in: a-proteobacteria)]|uniref:hypothetical protein n=1 Tax=Bosea sp. (in: a-proteobacteria) TaxID=1871050 RepID=UPI003F70A6D6